VVDRVGYPSGPQFQPSVRYLRTRLTMKGFTVLEQTEVDFRFWEWESLPKQYEILPIHGTFLTSPIDPFKENLSSPSDELLNPTNIV